MMAFRRFIFILMLFPFLTNAQTIVVKKESARIEGQNVPGYHVALSSGENEVRNSLIKYLRALGKIKTTGNYITMEEPVIAGKKYANVLYATTKEVGNTSAAWIGMRSESREESALDSDLGELTYDFGVAFHREKIQIEIDESLQALQAVEKQQLRLANQNKDLNSRIERNKRQKIELEKALVDNKLELEDLIKNLKANAKARDSVAIATEQIRKVVEMHQERKRKVE
jgi:hypothetical protein